MTERVKKSLFLILAALALCAFAVTGCSMFEVKKRYMMELEVKCPDGEKLQHPIPEIMLTGGLYV